MSLNAAICLIYLMRTRIDARLILTNYDCLTAIILILCFIMSIEIFHYL